MQSSLKSEGTNIICIIAGNQKEAYQWARGQLLDNNEWFFPHDFHDLQKRTNYHVIVVGSAGQNVPSAYFERFLQMAKERGRIGRV